MGLSFSHLLLLLVIVFIVFGAGKLPRVMGDIGRGIRSLRDGLKQDEGEGPPPKQIAQRSDEPVQKAERKDHQHHD